ncbi:TrmB family transcriptional regulator [Saccharolobus islandicus]|uniref:TrmB family transcriptional regulator n=1 Tax=Saccharolobus islandicus TaxID=43080 RepID=UPI00064FA3F2|nr:TrmB family transcriptional regulator [Sulfolobus islandicus]
MTPLLPKDYWRRFEDEDETDEDATKNGKANSKKSQSDSEKYKLSTRSSTEKRIARDKRVANATHATRFTNSLDYDSVDISNKSQIDEIIVKDEKNRKEVRVTIEKIGDKDVVVKDVIKTIPKLKITIRYKDKTWECNADVFETDDSLQTIGCEKTLSEVVRVTGRHPPKEQITDTINRYVDLSFEIKVTPLLDYVKQKYADRLAEIENEPFEWILQRTNEIVGYERLKLLTFLSIVSSQMRRIRGISRVHINIVGQSGAGKSSVVKSVLKFVADDDMKIDGTRFTEKSLGYLGIDSFDGRIVFLEQIDKQNIAYLKEAISEEKITTYVTVKVKTDDGEKYVTQKVTIEGQPVFISTSVADNVDLEKEQLENRILNVYLKYVYSREVIKSILERGNNEETSDIDKMVFMAYLHNRPEWADISPVESDIMKFTDRLAELTKSPVNRTAEVLRNLVRAVAIARGKAKADMDDLNFVMSNFQLDVFYNGLGLTERDIEIIEALPDTGGMKTQEVADALRMSKQYVLNLLKNIERKGIVEGSKDDNHTFTWSLTALGRRIKALVSDKDIVEVRDEKGELVGAVDAKFRPDADGGGNKENAVSGNDGGRVPGSDGETNRVIEAYKFLKERGWVRVMDIAGWFSDDIIEKLKRKDLVEFNIIDGVEYVRAK